MTNASNTQRRTADQDNPAYVSKPRSFSISELAREFDITTRTIRFYEEKGFLQPRRNGSQRIYSPADRTRLRLILRGKRIGLSLDESAEIINLYGSPGNNHKQLERLIERVQDKRTELERQQQDLEAMLTELAAVERNCREALDAL